MPKNNMQNSLSLLLLNVLLVRAEKVENIFGNNSVGHLYDENTTSSYDFPSSPDSFATACYTLSAVMFLAAVVCLCRHKDDLVDNPYYSVTRRSEEEGRLNQEDNPPPSYDGATPPAGLPAYHP